MLVIEPFTPSDNFEMIVNASLDVGYNFLKRLQVGINNKTNTFEGDNELLLCVKNSDGEVIAVGGIQVDPYEGYDNMVSKFYEPSGFKRSNAKRYTLFKFIFSV